MPFTCSTQQHCATHTSVQNACAPADVRDVTQCPCMHPTHNRGWFPSYSTDVCHSVRIRQLALTYSLPCCPASMTSPISINTRPDVHRMRGWHIVTRNLPSWRVRDHRFLHVCSVGVTPLQGVHSHAVRHCPIAISPKIRLDSLLLAANCGCSFQGAPLPGVSVSGPNGQGRNSHDRSASSGLGMDPEDTSGSRRSCGRGARKTAVGDTAAQCCAAAPARWPPGELPAR